MIKCSLVNFVAIFILCLSPANAKTHEVASPVPSDFQALVDTDAKFVFFVKPPRP